jgi:hypothetical protein
VKISERISIEYRKPDRIIVAGMGGSAIGGNLLKDWLRETVLTPIEVCRDYHLPAYVDEKTLVLVSSYSGNTEETINAFLEAVEKQCMIIAISSDGVLQEFSREMGLPFIKLPAGYPPRGSDFGIEIQNRVRLHGNSTESFNEKLSHQGCVVGGAAGGVVTSLKVTWTWAESGQTQNVRKPSTVRTNGKRRFSAAIMWLASVITVPVLMSAPYLRGGDGRPFDEVSCRGGQIGTIPAKELVPLAMAHAGKLEKFGALSGDVIVYDVLGDVVCGGFAMPMRGGIRPGGLPGDLRRAHVPVRGKQHLQGHCAARGAAPTAAFSISAGNKERLVARIAEDPQMTIPIMRARPTANKADLEPGSAPMPAGQ